MPYEYMSPIPMLYSPQARAVTGSRTPVPYDEYIRSQAQYLPALYEQRRISDIEKQRRDEEQKRMQIAEEQANREYRLSAIGTTTQALGTQPVFEKFTKPVLYERGIKPLFSRGASEAIPRILEPEIVQEGMEAVGSNIPMPATPSFVDKALGTTGKAFNLIKPVSAGVSIGSLVRQTNTGEYLHKQLGGGEKEWDTVLGGLGGAGAGALYGAQWGSVVPGVGNLVGAGLGAIAGSFFGYKKRGGCIIVTACTNPDSREVKICREFKDRFMDKDSVRGYYMFAEQIVPIIKNNDELKNTVKKHFVDKLTDYAEIALGYKTDFKYKDSAEISLKFMNLCRNLGKTIPRYIRENGEVV